jgi:hypothetical protein
VRPRITALVALILVGCPAHQWPVDPQLSEAEAQCLALDKARTALEIASCGQNIEGECSTDAIYDRAAPRRRACLGEK